MGCGRIVAVVLAASLLGSLVGRDAAAMPTNGSALAAKQLDIDLWHVRGTCGIYRCPRPHWLRYCWYWRWQPCPPNWDPYRHWW
jgi:hypothetical protein